ncbi:hypothetical protein DLM75_09890 [Leptospira stimsonii]|uniref:Uncharacterized protein n=1 Tax=Leptospira stimsonii TaxID=2202203 RepID=A0A396Z945_9LEPT|nr:hypothetical protein DLM75_09890 [Leptospira stimsonii]
MSGSESAKRLAETSANARAWRDATRRRVLIQRKDARVNRNVARGTPEFYFPKEVFFLRLIFEIREGFVSLSKFPEYRDAELRDNT